MLVFPRYREQMANDTRDLPTASASSETPTAPPPKKFPKGVVLGKDGKP